MSRRNSRSQRQYSEKADPNIAVVVAQQGVAAPATMPRNMRAYIAEIARSFPQVEVTREQYRDLLRAKR
jgi:hypothetical protein